MGNIFTVISNLAGNITQLHFNLKLGILGIIICILHTVGAMYLLANKMVSDSIGEMILEFSLGTMVLIVIGLVLTTGKRKSNAKCTVDTPKE